MLEHSTRKSGKLCLIFKLKLHSGNKRGCVMKVVNNEREAIKKVRLLNLTDADHEYYWEPVETMHLPKSKLKRFLDWTGIIVVLVFLVLLVCLTMCNIEVIKDEVMKYQGMETITIIKGGE